MTVVGRPAHLLPTTVLNIRSMSQRWRESPRSRNLQDDEIHTSSELWRKAFVQRYFLLRFRDGGAEIFQQLLSLLQVFRHTDRAWREMAMFLQLPGLCFGVSSVFAMAALLAKSAEWYRAHSASALFLLLPCWCNTWFFQSSRVAKVSTTTATGREQKLSWKNGFVLRRPRPPWNRKAIA